MDISKFITEFLLENETDFHEIKGLRLLKLKGILVLKIERISCFYLKNFLSSMCIIKDDVV